MKGGKDKEVHLFYMHLEFVISRVAYNEFVALS